MYVNSRLVSADISAKIGVHYIYKSEKDAGISKFRDIAI